MSKKISILKRNSKEKRFVDHSIIISIFEAIEVSFVDSFFVHSSAKRALSINGGHSKFKSLDFDPHCCLPRTWIRTVSIPMERYRLRSLLSSRSKRS